MLPATLLTLTEPTRSVLMPFWQLSTKRRKRVQNGPFLGNDERLFWQRAEDRNRATASLYDQLGLACYEAMEAFVEYKPL